MPVATSLKQQMVRPAEGSREPVQTGRSSVRSRNLGRKLLFSVVCSWISLAGRSSLMSKQTPPTVCRVAGGGERGSGFMVRTGMSR